MKFRIDSLFDMENTSSDHFDLVQIDQNIYHAIYFNRSYTIELIGQDRNAREFQLKINGRPIQVKAIREVDDFFEEFRAQHSENSSQNEVYAPMPGKILDLKVKIGEQVKSGQNLLVLEAMKMENMLEAPQDSKIENIHVVQGENVMKGQLLISLEPISQ